MGEAQRPSDDSGLDLTKTATELEEVTEEEKIRYSALESLPPDLRLLRKLDGWLRMQPEWVVFLSGTREQRRQLAQKIAKAITTIPKI